jgi:hypothetical protein
LHFLNERRTTRISVGITLQAGEGTNIKTLHKLVRKIARRWGVEWHEYVK